MRTVVDLPSEEIRRRPDGIARGSIRINARRAIRNFSPVAQRKRERERGGRDERRDAEIARRWLHRIFNWMFDPISRFLYNLIHSSI